MRPIALAALIAATPAPALADSITIEAEDGFRLVRCVDMFGSASCEYLSTSPDMMDCIALDAEGEPLAVAPAFGGNGAVIFQGLPASHISDVICAS